MQQTDIHSFVIQIKTISKNIVSENKLGDHQKPCRKS